MFSNGTSSSTIRIFSRLPRTIFLSSGLGGAGGSGDLGRWMWKVVPRPSSLSTAMCPLLCLMIFCTKVSPKPVPRPTDLVVKKGSKILSITSGLMPRPVSLTAR